MLLEAEVENWQTEGREIESGGVFLTATEKEENEERTLGCRWARDCAWWRQQVGREAGSR